jgi:hypothetical protein
LPSRDDIQIITEIIEKALRDLGSIGEREINKLKDFMVRAALENINTNALFNSNNNSNRALPSTLRGTGLNISNANWDNNTASDLSFPGNRHIYSEKEANASRILMGIAPISSNACGWIAVFNVLIEVGMYKMPAEIIRYFEHNDGLIADGALGVNPTAFEKYFKTQGLTAETTLLNIRDINRTNSNRVDLDKKAKAGTTAILGYFHDGAPFGGAHYITITWDAATGKYKAWNVESDDTKHRYYDSIDDILSERNRTFLSLTVIERNNPVDTRPPQTPPRNLPQGGTWM